MLETKGLKLARGRSLKTVNVLLVVWINHSIPERLIQTTRGLRIVVLLFRSQGKLVIETNH